MSFKQKVAILGSTGSIGKTTLNIISKNLNQFSVELLSCLNNKLLIIKQIKKFLPKYVIISNLEVLKYVKKIKFKKKIIFFYNLADFNKYNKLVFDKTILAISSIDGLPFAFSFINFSKKILIANKETIVCGGNFFLNASKKKKLHCRINRFRTLLFSREP